LCHRFGFSSVQWYGSIAAGNGIAFCCYAGTTTAGLESANGGSYAADGDAYTADSNAHAADGKPGSGVTDATYVDTWFFKHDSATAGRIDSMRTLAG